jgi:hypothetical protein
VDEPLPPPPKKRTTTKMSEEERAARREARKRKREAMTPEEIEQQRAVRRQKRMAKAAVAPPPSATEEVVVKKEWITEPHIVRLNSLTNAIICIYARIDDVSFDGVDDAVTAVRGALNQPYSTAFGSKWYDVAHFAKLHAPTPAHRVLEL